MPKEEKDGTNWNSNIQRFVYAILLNSMYFYFSCWSYFHPVVKFSLNLIAFKAKEMGYKSVAHLLMDELQKAVKCKRLRYVNQLTWAPSL